MVSQASDTKELMEWIDFCLGCGSLAYGPSLLDRILGMNLSLMDVIQVLQAPTSISRDFAPGCVTFRGPTIDWDGVAVVVAERSEVPRIKLVKVWRD
jgi:hypothetical protein